MTPTTVSPAALRLAVALTSLCPGSGELVRAERTDGNGVVACPHCHRFRLTYEADDGYWTVEIHRTLWVGQ